jgi:hypothetical protein
MPPGHKQQLQIVHHTLVVLWPASAKLDGCLVASVFDPVPLLPHPQLVASVHVVVSASAVSPLGGFGWSVFHPQLCSGMQEFEAGMVCSGVSKSWCEVLSAAQLAESGSLRTSSHVATFWQVRGAIAEASRSSRGACYQARFTGPRVPKTVRIFNKGEGGHPTAGTCSVAGWCRSDHS